ncbi:hypothetical protein WOLCODRAFT_141288 [Wolfiporia cocos MD-104 SS10]|uniref:ferric-chelate reductase (NADPH) n=1 Tax=Wolfiporia cocos (strain MD-104) TaxID=742152 RepID=A0A2H3JB59_WOLCO|nr:hypothetical protein WOLCODRAFT_141288 [Wolfiporia cocos MD-104 SS10]
MPSWSTMFPLVSSYLNIVIRPGHSVGSLLLLTFYNQAGMLSTSQIPVAILMATKNSVMGALAGRGYEKLNFLHRFAGRVIVLAANVHALGYIYQWTLDGSFIAHVSPSIAWGIAALVCVDILFFFSISIVREVLHHTFYISHVVSAIILMAATCRHIPVAIPYVLAAVGFYAFDLVVRLIRTRVASANLCTIPELSMVRIQVPGIDSGWHAGQHLRIKVLSPAMGWFGWAESHPFTIASASKNVDGEGLVLMCKKAGDWTNKLFDLAACAEFCEATGPGMNIRVVIDGPYGGHGHTIVSSFSGALLVSGGSGITYALSTVQELLRDAMMGSSRVRNVKLVWSVPDPTSIVPLLPMFIGMLERAQTTYTKLEISTFFTQAPTSEDIFDPFHRLPSGLSLSPGRPRISRILGYVVDLTCEAQKESGYRSSGVFVGTCGPLSLVEEVGSTVRTFPTAKAKTVGGIECHKEIFAW